MKKLTLLFLYCTCSIMLFAQSEQDDLKMSVDYSSDNAEIRDILDFEGIDYQKIKFTGKDLKDKSYHLTVKEIWNGKVVTDSTIINTAEIGVESLEHVNDTILSFKVLSKRTFDNQLKMTFKFPRFSVTRKFKATNSDDYSLRNIADESQLGVRYDEPFYLLAYILPYEREDGSSSWCAVGTSGKDIENWGEKFGIKHYLVFEMKFE